ncbi:hydroxyethylthiazole kinase [Clostridium sp. HCS.1]|uniref:hydroxyethylthiazole kinase n=1 Tax=Clostridium sp. HCS.1 TaxID=3238594 RepID=UPI003A10275E
MLSKMLKNIKEKNPLIHCITNYVTVNDCANILIACGASPIMADEKEEVEEITSICNGLNINIGTLNKNVIESMILAGKKANVLSHPVTFDPVGVGASNLRNSTAKRLLEEVKFAVIRGNISEIKALALGSGRTKGVDANISDVVTDENIDGVISFAKDFSKKTKSIIAISGAIDIVCNENTAYVIRNGHKMMSKITGSGCMLTTLISAFVAANDDNYLEATVAALCTMGIAGENAYEILKKNNSGNSSYRNYLIDEVYKLTEEDLEGGAKFEIK